MRTHVAASVIIWAASFLRSHHNATECSNWNKCGVRTNARISDEGSDRHGLAGFRYWNLELCHIGCRPTFHVDRYDHVYAHIADDSQLRKSLVSRRLPEILDSAAAFDEVPTAMMGVKAGRVDTLPEAPSVVTSMSCSSTGTTIQKTPLTRPFLQSMSDHFDLPSE